MDDGARAVMPEARLTDEMIESMRARAGTDLRIDHSIFDEEATRIAVLNTGEKSGEAQYRKFVYLSDVVTLSGTVTEKFVDEEGERCVRVETRAQNQRGENVMPGSAVVALPGRDTTGSPASRRAAGVRA